MAILGNTRRVYIVTGTSSLTYTVMAGEQSNSLNRTAEAIEVSDKSSEWAQFISGKKGATAEVTVFLNDLNTDKQYDVLSALQAGNKVKVFIGTLNTNTPSQGDVFEAIITAINDTNDVGAVSTRNISLTVTGPVTHYPTIS
jgi:predicted secreted protein